ncbi:outer membrane beta-barrel protein [Microbulbifer sp. SSSA002]|uniref:outer membrane beta-barrel protein n=1 Tax=unclassified Microbulbifer TaxID=2619833 RepID=UPI004039F0C6
MKYLKNSLKTHLASTLTLFFSISVSAEAPSQKYIGATLGITSNTQFCSFATPQIKSQIVQKSIDGRYQCDKNGSNIKLYGGFQWGKYIAVEFNYQKPSSAEVSFRTENEHGEYIRASYRLNKQLLSSFLLGIYPLNTHLNLFARLGGGLWRGEITTQQAAKLHIPQQLPSGQYTPQLYSYNQKTSTNHNGSHWGYGIGMNYTYGKRWALRLEWETLEASGVDFNAESLSLGLERKF